MGPGVFREVLVFVPASALAIQIIYTSKSVSWGTIGTTLTIIHLDARYVHVYPLVNLNDTE